MLKKVIVRPAKRAKKKVNFEGGAIVAPKLKKKKKDEKVEEALDAQAAKMGGAIRKPTLKKKKKKPKIEEALDAQAEKMGGSIKNKTQEAPQRPAKIFHTPTHKYLWQKLSGVGGRMDTPFCREKMHQLMSRFHPSVFQTYLTGKVHMETPDYHERTHPIAKNNPKDNRPTFVDMGGSLRAVSHSENGLLQAFDSTFHHQLQLI